MTHDPEGAPVVGNPTAGLDGPSRTVIVEPVERPAYVPRETPTPTPEKAPAAPEKVPA